MNTTVPPISGLALSTVLVTFRSACLGVTSTLLVSSLVVVCDSSSEKTDAVLVIAPTPVTVAVIVIVAEAPGPSTPTVQ